MVKSVIPLVDADEVINPCIEETFASNLDLVGRNRNKIDREEQ